MDFRRRSRAVSVLFYTLLVHPPISQLSLAVSFIHLTALSLHNKPGVLHMIPPGTFPVASAGAALTLFPFAPATPAKPRAGGQAGKRSEIIVLWPAFPSSQHQVFKSAQVSHHRESENEERGIIGKCQPCDDRCLNAMPEFVYFSLHRCACTSRLLLSPTYRRLSNPLWQDSWPR